MFNRNFLWGILLYWFLVKWKQQAYILLMTHLPISPMLNAAVFFFSTWSWVQNRDCSFKLNWGYSSVWYKSTLKTKKYSKVQKLYITWIPWNLSLRYIHCSGQFTPKMKANAEPRLLSSLVWIDSGVVVSQRCGVTASSGVFFHEWKCDGMTCFMEFMIISYILLA